MIFLLLLLLLLISPCIAYKKMQARHSLGGVAGKAAHRLQTALPSRCPPRKQTAINPCMCRQTSLVA